MKWVYRNWFVLFFLASWNILHAQPFVAGTTYYGSQQNGSCGRTIGLDQTGYVQAVWTKSFSASGTNRHVFWNLWNPGTRSFIDPSGYQIDVYGRAGYVTLAVSPEGWCYPAFHVSVQQTIQPCIGIDYFPKLGVYTGFRPSIFVDGLLVQSGFPKIAMGLNGILHTVVTEVPELSGPMRIFYFRATPVFETDGTGLRIDFNNWNGNELLLLDTIDTYSVDIACSNVEDQVAVARIKNADVYLQVSDDGGFTWNPATNITQFIPADFLCYETTQNWACCDRDTTRAYQDLSILYDNNGFIHIAFTTVGNFVWTELGQEANPQKPEKAQIWHWSETTGQLNLIAENWMDRGDLQERTLCHDHAMTCCPSLTLDRVTGSLFCSYLNYDTAQYSEMGFLNADVVVSVSFDGGDHWSVGTNVTNSAPEVIPAPLGQNASEDDATLADHVYNDSLHLFYLLNTDACTHMETVSNYQMKYLPVAISDIQTTPLMPDRPFHVDLVPCDNLAGRKDTSLLPVQFDVSVFPNPFNSTTRIGFDLPRSTEAELRIYDILGQTVDIVTSGRAEAGHYEYVWDAGSNSAGMYFLTLKTPLAAKTQKLLYLK